MNIDFYFYWKLLLRRLPAMSVLFLLSSAVGILLAINLPETYTTEARLLVESAQIPGELAETTVTTSPAEQLEIIQQRLMTRANLLDIANKYNIYEGENLNPDELVEAMREDTEFDTQTGRDQATLTSITFAAGEAEAAANVVNEYVTLILAANVEFRTNTVSETLDFFEAEVERLGAELDRQRTRILEFQGENASALPGDLEFRMGRQALLQERLTNTTRELNALNQQRERTVTVFEETGRLAGDAAEPPSRQEQALMSLEAELEEARVNFSDSNPRVILLQERVERMREALGSNVGDSAAARGETTQETLYNLTLTTLDDQIAVLAEDKVTIEAELETLSDSIERTPANSIALQALERDYANLQAQYNATVNNRAQAEMGERIELTSRGQRISVIENASVPTAPSSPNRPLIAFLGVAIGAALAGALFMLLEFLNSSIRRSNELVNKLGITPLATVPYMETNLSKSVRRGIRILTFLAVLIALPTFLWLIDTYYVPLDILMIRLADRF